MGTRHSGPDCRHGSHPSMCRCLLRTHLPGRGRFPRCVGAAGPGGGPCVYASVLPPRMPSRVADGRSLGWRRPPFHVKRGCLCTATTFGSRLLSPIWRRSHSGLDCRHASPTGVSVTALQRTDGSNRTIVRDAESSATRPRTHAYRLVPPDTLRVGALELEPLRPQERHVSRETADGPVVGCGLRGERVASMPDRPTGRGSHVC